MKGTSKSGMNLLKGMTRKNPSGDSGMRPSGKTVSDGAVRDNVAHGHSIGGREA